MTKKLPPAVIFELPPAVIDAGDDPGDGKPGMNACMRTHPGFTITCDACGSGRVILGHDLAFSQTGPVCGAVWLECLACGADRTLIEI